MRAAVPGDAEAIASVHVRSWQVAYAHAFPAEALAGLSDDLERRTRAWRAAVEPDARGSRVFVAERAGRLVGFANVEPARDDDLDAGRVGELVALYVLPDAWGRGAGRALMDVLLAALRDAGFDEASLWVLEDNPRARGFYERAGWRVDGAVKDDEFLGTMVREVRYRIRLGD